MVIGLSVGGRLLWPDMAGKIGEFAHHVTRFTEMIWVGTVIGVIIAISFSFLPNKFINFFFKGKNSLMKCIIAGFLFDVCSHGVLLIAVALYKKGVRLGHVIAFLISTPWNSFSVMVILMNNIGVSLTLVFTGLSMVLAYSTGVCFELLGDRVPQYNKDTRPTTASSLISQRLAESFHWQDWSLKGIFVHIGQQIIAIKSLVRWLLLGILIAAVLRLFLSDVSMMKFFAPSLIGMLATLGLATVIEVCSEGMVPFALDIYTYARAQGNVFVFLLAGVATDITEILILREMTKQWGVVVFYMLILLPQVLLIGWLLNNYPL